MTIPPDPNPRTYVPWSSMWTEIKSIRNLQLNHIKVDGRLLQDDPISDLCLVVDLFLIMLKCIDDLSGECFQTLATTLERFGKYHRDGVSSNKSQGCVIV